MKTVEINITGIVQGVGFRPFLFNLARELNLNGYVLNRGNAGVRLVLQGKPERIEHFIKRLKDEKPEISYIEKIETTVINSQQRFEDLNIKRSEEGRGISLTLPPDVAICQNCLKDLRNPKKPRYHNYPFVACAQCGPRFTTVKSLPYDRERSTMKEFPFCIDCKQEYSDFKNRRFHAQTYACSICGPSYELYDSNHQIIKKDSREEILEYAARKINDGKIVAVKGIGGTHLVCLADEDKPVLKLRKKKGRRKYKPFALMIPNLNLIEKFFHISQEEKRVISSFRRPIVLLEKKSSFEHSQISSWIAPGLNNIGFMLPYSGIHYLLFDYVGQKPLVYTSGNASNMPMATKNENIFKQLDHLADFYLLHNRNIYQRADDSVLRLHGSNKKIIRRSRGFVPEYIPLPFQVKIPGAIATGPELAVTGAILRRNRVFPTQHIGNTTNLETQTFLKNSLNHMKNLLKIKDKEIKFIACDAHPRFITTRYAQELADNFQIPLFPIQHHYAHVLGLMAEKRIKENESIIAITTDGVGYGNDGNVWGGEILKAKYNMYERLGHLEYQPMVGGDRCTRFPARMYASILLHHLKTNEAKKIFNRIRLEKDLEYGNTELDALIKQYEQAEGNFPAENVPLTSSTGRILDAISYLLGACSLKTYRGEPAMRLEGLASKGNFKKLNLKFNILKENSQDIIKTSTAIQKITDLIFDRSHNNADIAKSFHIEFANAIAQVAIKNAEKYKINKIGLTGGVAYNSLFSKTIKERVKKEGFTFLEHDNIPPGDAGVSIGQLIGGLFKVP